LLKSESKKFKKHISAFFKLSYSFTSALRYLLIIIEQ